MIVEIPDEVWTEMKAKAQAAFDEAHQEMIQDFIQGFVAVTTLDDDGQKFLHVATGRTLTIKATWDDGSANS